MDWIPAFYARQEALTGVYTTPIQPHHRARAAALTHPAPDTPGHVLELGCGGGQLAAAVADLGHRVTAIDLNPAAIAHARQLAADRPDGQLTVREGDFYAIDLPSDAFDAVCYWDGFGIGSDADQRRLLRRIAAWLRPDGCAWIDIYTPWYWARVAGQTMRFDRAERRYGFNPEGSRMEDAWWPLGCPQDAVTQSLRCYSPDDLRLLLEGTGLALKSWTLGPGRNPATERFTPQAAALIDAMSYTARLERCVSSATP